MSRLGWRVSVSPPTWGFRNMDLPGLPPIGTEIPCSHLALNVPVRYEDQLHTLDFRGGIKHRMEVSPDYPINSVRTRVAGHRFSAEIPAVGTVTMEQNDIAVGAKGLLRQTREFPPRYEHREACPGHRTVKPAASVSKVVVPSCAVARTATCQAPRGDDAARALVTLAV